MAEKGSKTSTAYFKLGHPAINITIVVGLALVFTTWMSPDGFISSILNRLFGKLALSFGVEFSTVISTLVYIALIGHTAESVHVVQIARRNNLDIASTIKWVVSTFILGMGSMLILKRYDAKQRKSRSNLKEKPKPKARNLK